MTEHMPESVQKSMDKERRSEVKRFSRMKVRTGGQEITILRSWPTGFSLDLSESTPLRGFVDIYEGHLHICKALIVTSREEEGERIFEFKYSNRATDRPPLVDSMQDGTDPVSLTPGT